MQLQAESYNQALQQFAVELAKWKGYIAQQQQVIAAKIDAGEPVAKYETAINIQQQRIDKVEAVLDYADDYIQALQAEIKQLKQQHHPTTHYQDRTGPTQALRICDYPVSDTERHNELLDLLHDIKKALQPKPLRLNN